MKSQLNNVYWYTDIHINVTCHNKIFSEIEREREGER